MRDDFHAGDHAHRTSGDVTYVPDPRVVSSRLGDDLALVHLETNGIYTLNRTGRRVWELVAAGVDRRTIEQRLLDEFDVQKAQLHQEVEELLSMLVENRLVIPA